VNQLGGVFINGRPLPNHIRLKIIEMAAAGKTNKMFMRDKAKLLLRFKCNVHIFFQYPKYESDKK
jgi:hypothetical protein